MRTIAQSYIDEGIRQGINEGIRQGIDQGKAEERKAMAINMLKHKADVNFISSVTELSIEQLERLKQDCLF